MKKFWFSLLVATMGLLGFAAEPSTVKIGIILPLTGNNAQVGQPQLRAVELFKHELATGSYKHKYEVIVEDDQFLPRKTADATNKLLYLDKVDAIVSYGIAPGNVVAPRTAKAGIPMMCINASFPKIADGKTNFLHWPTVPEETEMVAALMEKQGCKRVAFLSDRSPGIVAIAQEIKTRAQNRGIEVVADYTFNPNERNFRPVLALINEKNPDTFLPFAISPELDIILNQRKQAGLMCRLTGFEVFNFLGDKKSAEGTYYISPSLGTTDFQTRLKAVTGKESDYCVAYVYDALALLRSAYEAQEKIDHAKACEWIQSLENYPSAVGPITVDEHGLIHSPVCVFQIRDGKSVEVPMEEVK